MIAFVASKTSDRALEIKAAGRFDDVTWPSAFYELRGPHATSEIVKAVEDSEIFIADWRGGLDLWGVFWFGAALAAGVPVVGFVHPGERPDRKLPLIRHSVVTVEETRADLRLALQKLSIGVKGGFAGYAEAVTELHSKYVERIG